jgi:hypothetical protein
MVRAMGALRPSEASSGLPANIGTQSDPRVAPQFGRTATVDFGGRRENDWHSLGLDRRDDCVRFGSQKPEQLVLALDSERSWAEALEACNAASSARSTE